MTNQPPIVAILDWLLGRGSARHVTLDDLTNIETKLMSAISEFAARVQAHQDKIDAAISDVAGDVADLKSLVEQLQGTSGQITPEDQGLLDQIETKAGAAASKLEALAAEHPPVEPPVDPEEPVDPPVDPSSVAPPVERDRSVKDWS